MSSRLEVNVHVIRQVQNPWLEVGGPTAHWLRPETLVEVTVEGRNIVALADSGSQVNTITPTLVQQYGFLVLPLEDLVDYPVNLVGLGGMCTSPLGFVILHIQVQGVTGYDEDAVFLVVPDGSNFGVKGLFGHGDLHYQQTNQHYLQERDRQPHHDVVNCKVGVTAFLLVGNSCPWS